MTAFRTSLLPGLMVLAIPVFADSSYHAHFLRTFADYGKSVERCQTIRANAAPQARRLSHR